MDDTPKRRLVRATRTGFYGGHRIREGKTFSVLPAEFSASWMAAAEPGAVDELEKAREASPKQRGPAGVELKAKPKPPPPGGRRGLEPDAGI